MHRPIYFLEKAFHNLRQSLALNLVAVAIYSFLLSLFGGFLLLYSNLSSILELWGDKIQVVAYVKEEPKGDEKTIDRLKKQLTLMKEVESVIYISKDLALERFAGTLGGQAGILDGLESNPLPPSIEITLAGEFRQTPHIVALAKEVKSWPDVEDVQYGQEWVEKFDVFRGFFLLAAVVVGIIIFGLATFVVMGVIYFTVTARRDEIEIQKLVGATDAFVKAPFLIEGIIQGLVSGLLSVAVLFVFFKVTFSKVAYALGASLGFSSVSFLPFSMILLLVLGSGFLAFFGSWFAVGRFLKV